MIQEEYKEILNGILRGEYPLSFAQGFIEGYVEQTREIAYRKGFDDALKLKQKGQ